MILPILIKKKDGYYYYDDPSQKADNVTGIVIGPNSGCLRVHNIMYDVTRALDNELKSLDAVAIETKALYTIPSVDYDTARLVLSFLRQVYKEHRSEGAVLLTLNRKEPLDKQKYKVIVPTQEVASSAVDYKDIDKIPLEDGEFLAGSIHSHPHFSAFQSATDHKDEISFDGLHITMGHIDKPVPEIHTRLCFAGRVYEKLDKPMIELEQTKDRVLHGYDGVLTELETILSNAGLSIDKKEAAKALQPLMKIKIDPITDVEVPEDWMKKVTSKTYRTTTVSGYNGNGGGVYNWWRDQQNRHLTSSGPNRTAVVSKSPADIIKPEDFCFFLNRHVHTVGVRDVVLLATALSKIEPTLAQIKTFHKTIGAA